MTYLNSTRRTHRDSFQLGPTVLVRSGQPDDCAKMLVLPFAIHLHIVILIAAGYPPCIILLAKGERPEQVPSALRAVTIDLDDRIHQVVLREADQLLKAFEQFSNRCVSL